MGSADFDHQLQQLGSSGALLSYCSSFCFLIIAGALAFWWLLQKKSRGMYQKLPPGPIQWPFVGCLPAVGFRYRHHTFYELSKRYGDIIYLPIGSANIIAIHGPELAREMLKTQDAQFCSRPLSTVGKYIGFDHHDVNLCPYNLNWKAVRKAFSVELLSPSRLSLQTPIRRAEILAMAYSVMNTAKRGDVNVTKVTNDVVTNIIVRMLFGNRYVNPDKNSIAEVLQNFEPTVREGNFLWGAVNLADYFPILARFDLQGLEARFQKLIFELERLFRLIIDEHREHLKEMGATVLEEDKDIIDLLLSQDQLSDKQIMGILSNTLIAGIDTTHRAVEWAMAEIAANPHTLDKAQEELDRVVGCERLVDESDIPNLPYLQAIAKEVLRLHPSAPLDDPHLNEEATTLGGYHIPAKSILLLNLWALGQEPSIWNNPQQFNPDRFVGSDLNVFGNHYQLLPFSSGRRRCPAYQLATLKLQHILAVLLQLFDWAPPPGMLPCDINLEEGDGIVVGLKHPLILSAKPRLPAAVLGSV